MPDSLWSDDSTCPHCGKPTLNWTESESREFMSGVPSYVRRNPARHAKAEGGYVGMDAYYCLSCDRPTIVYAEGTFSGWDDGIMNGEAQGSAQCYPPGLPCPELHASIPKPVASAFREACAVARLSPNACAILCRRALQALLRADVRVQHKGSLKREISQFLQFQPAPQRIVEALGLLSDVGAIGAHPGSDSGPDDVIDISLDDARHILALSWEVISHHYPNPGAAPDPLAAVKTIQVAKHRPPR